MFNWKSRVAVVTGGATGLGGAISSELAELGVIVVIFDRNSDLGSKKVLEIRQRGGQAEFYSVDVSHYPTFSGVFEQVLNHYGKIDFMFNNAGIALAGEIRDLPVEKWIPLFETNLFGVIYGCQLAYRKMCDQGFGHIINIGSTLGLLPAPFFSHYSTSKFGVVGFTEALRIEAEKYGVKVHLICPGFVETDLISSGYTAGMESSKVRDAVRFLSITPATAARRILRSIERSQFFALFPWYTQIFLLVFRFLRPLNDWVNRNSITKMRELSRVSKG